MTEAVLRRVRLQDALRAHAAEIENQGWPTPLSRDLRHAAEYIEWLEAVTNEYEAQGEGPEQMKQPVLPRAPTPAEIQSQQETFLAAFAARDSERCAEREAEAEEKGIALRNQQMGAPPPLKPRRGRG